MPEAAAQGKRIRKSTAKATPPSPPPTKAKTTPESIHIAAIEATPIASKARSKPVASAKANAHKISVMITILLDNRHIGTDNSVVDLSDPQRLTYNQIYANCQAQANSFSSKRGLSQPIYKGRWKATFGSQRNPDYSIINTANDWLNLEELIRHRKEISGAKSASIVTLNTRFCQHGNPDSSPPPEAGGRVNKPSKARPDTIRKALITQSPTTEVEPSLPAHIGRQSATTRQLNQLTKEEEKMDPVEQQEMALFSKWMCRESTCRNKNNLCFFSPHSVSHYILQTTDLTPWARDLCRQAPGVTLSFPGGRRSNEWKNDPRRQAKNTFDKRKSAISIAESINSTPSSVPPVFHININGTSAGFGGFPAAATPHCPTTPNQRENQREMLILPSSPIQSNCDRSSLLEDFSMWLVQYARPGDQQEAVGLIAVAIQQRLSLEDLQRRPIEKLTKMGILGGPLLLVQDYISEFKRQFKTQQSLIALRSSQLLLTSQEMQPGCIDNVQTGSSKHYYSYISSDEIDGEGGEEECSEEEGGKGEGAVDIP
jgi:hypothetical protein